MNALAQNVTKLSKDYEALKKKCRQQQAEIEALKKKINGDAFCDANCVWTDHHPDCHIGKE